MPPWDYPRGIDDISKTPDLTAGLVERGYSEADVKKILGDNFVRIYEEVWD